MLMASSPGHHRQGDAEVIVLPRRTAIDGAGFTKLYLQICELFVGAAQRWRVGQPDLAALQFRLQELQQNRAADRVNRHRTASDQPALKFGASAKTGNMQSDDSRTESLKQVLGVTRIIAQ